MSTQVRVETENFQFTESVEFNGSSGLIIKTGQSLKLGNTSRSTWPDEGIASTAPALSILGNINQTNDAIATYISADNTTSNPVPLAAIANKNLDTTKSIKFQQIPRECIDADIVNSLQYKSGKIRKFWMPWESEAKPYFVKTAFSQAVTATWLPYVWNEVNTSGHTTQMLWPNMSSQSQSSYNLNYHTPYYTANGTYINLQSLYMPKNSGAATVISVLLLKIRKGNHTAEAYSTQINNSDWQIIDAIPAFQRAAAKTVGGTTTWGVTDTPFQLEFLELRGFVPAGYTYAIDARDYNSLGVLSTDLSTRFARYFGFAGEFTLST